MYIQGRLQNKSEIDIKRNIQKQFPPDFKFQKHLNNAKERKAHSMSWKNTLNEIKTNDLSITMDNKKLVKKINSKQLTASLIVEYPLKDKLVDLVMLYENEFKSFPHLITTNNIGQLLAEKIPSLKNRIYEYHSASKGEFIELATEIILSKCDVLIFITDPLDVHLYQINVMIMRIIFQKIIYGLKMYWDFFVIVFARTV